MSTMAIIIFPYSGYEARSEMKDLFWETIESCLEMIPDFPPLIVLNMDTVNRGLAKKLLEDSIREDNSNREFINYNNRQINICRVGLLIHAKCGLPVGDTL